MKKRFVKNKVIALSIAIVLIFAMLLFASGCNPSENTAENLKTDANPSVEQKANDQRAEAQTKNTAVSSEEPSLTDKLIGEAAAKEKAFAHAGVSPKEATSERVKLDKDNGRFEYEIDFRVGNTEYGYEINAVNGEIIDFDRDIEGKAEKVSATSSKVDSVEKITAEKALELALAHAGVLKENAVMDRVEPDFEKGKEIYEVDFHSAGYDYDYDIEAETGIIIRFEKERDD